MIISMLPIYTQYFTEFKIVVWDIFDFFGSVLDLDCFRRCVPFHNFKTLKYVLLRLSKNDYYYTIHLFSTFDRICNSSFVYFRFFSAVIQLEIFSQMHPFYLINHEMDFAQIFKK